MKYEAPGLNKIQTEDMAYCENGSVAGYDGGDWVYVCKIGGDIGASDRATCTGGQINYIGIA